MKLTRFWMVWSPQGHAPTRPHQSRERADAEAARLAAANPGRRFFVLKAVGGSEASMPEVKPVRFAKGEVAAGGPTDDIPF